MAVDGSFSLHSSLRRLLDRCPKLQCFLQFESLARRGDLVTEEELVNVLVGVFLHPSYTIPLMGCFRPIAQSIVDKAVALLGLVPNLRSIPEGTACEVDPDRVLDGVVNVIEIFSQQGRGLDLHELACLAFCHALDMSPFLLSSILSYLNFAPAPFVRFSLKHVMVETQELHITRISYRLLLMEPEIFTKLWDWSCFIDLVKDPCKSDLTWCGVQILSVLLKLGYKATENLNIGVEEAFSCVLRWEEFCQDTSLKKAGWYVEPTDYVQKWPVLLYGPSGSGKSALISKLAQDSGNQVLSIQMDDQIDGRTLVGAYVSTVDEATFCGWLFSATKLVNPFFVLLDPEFAHNLGVSFAARGWIPREKRPDPTILGLEVWGRKFSNPVCLVFDKNVAAVDGLLALGFGFVEVGSVTPVSQNGNPKPRIFRLRDEGAIINRSGFNSEGIVAVAKRLGAQHGKRKLDETSSSSPSSNNEVKQADYVQGVHTLSQYVDYLVINVSSPNTPCLCMLQGRKQLKDLVKKVQAACDEMQWGEEGPPPLLVKIAPDLSNEDLEDIAVVALALHLDGLIISNTTISRPDPVNKNPLVV
ncbi:unnamed protein product [Sphenostylis stenocarpa]|uniref:Dihydroorotate dehydrogenase (quinone), mitochondrial n=1 Tax=Sphenostylis stenocarpa TaxID=92480 RepID=A0AA86SFU5_9FABA|nr:unnamed protein product [Sphenostylis stenocarpa]